jgi:hypothetical protein
MTEFLPGIDPDREPKPASPEAVELFEFLVGDIINQAAYKLQIEDSVRVDFDRHDGTSIVLEKGPFTDLFLCDEAVMVRINKLIKEKSDWRTELHQKYAYSSRAGKSAYEEEVVDYYRGKRLRNEFDQELISTLPNDGAELLAVLKGIMPKELASEATQRTLELEEKQLQATELGLSGLSTEQVVEVIYELLKLNPKNSIKIEEDKDVVKYVRDSINDYFGLDDEEPGD